MELPLEIITQIIYLCFKLTKHQNIVSQFMLINSTQFRCVLHNIQIIKLLYTKHPTFIYKYIFRFGYISKLLLSSHWFDPFLCGNKGIMELDDHRHNDALSIILKDPRFNRYKTFWQLLYEWFITYFIPSTFILTILTIIFGTVLCCFGIEIIKIMYIWLLLVVVAFYWTLSVWDENVEKQYYCRRNLYIRRNML